MKLVVSRPDLTQHLSPPVSECARRMALALLLIHHRLSTKTTKCKAVYFAGRSPAIFPVDRTLANPTCAGTVCVGASTLALFLTNCTIIPAFPGALRTSHDKTRFAHGVPFSLYRSRFPTFTAAVRGHDTADRGRRCAGRSRCTLRAVGVNATNGVKTTTCGKNYEKKKIQTEHRPGRLIVLLLFPKNGDRVGSGQRKSKHGKSQTYDTVVTTERRFRFCRRKSAPSLPP